METLKFLKANYWSYKLHIFSLGALSVVSGLLSGFGISAMVPLVTLLVGGQTAESSDPITDFVVRLFQYLPFKYSLYSLLALIVAVFLLRTAIFIFFGYLRAKIVYNYKVETLTNLFSALLRAKWAYLLRQKMGYVQNIFIRDVDKSAELLGDIAYILFAVVNAAIFLIFALTIDARTSLIIMLGGVVVFFALRPIIKKFKSVVAELAAEYRRITHFMAEHILGIKSIKIGSPVPRVLEEAGALFRSWRWLEFRSRMLSYFSKNSWEPLTITLISLTLVITYNRPGFSFQVFVATVFLVQRFFVQVQDFYGALQSVIESIPHVKLIAEFRESLESWVEEKSSGRPFAFQDELVFENVSFSYGDSDNHKVLSGVGFGIKKGEIVGFIGPSGAGKTSVVDLMMRLFEPTSGRILVDGIDSRDFDINDWRNSMGYVPQDIFLLNDTVRQNVVFYHPDIGRKEVVASLSQANLYDFIRGLKDGLETVVGDRGVMLSGGQRQRVALARVLARNPQILLLDEATSALDNESETLIQQAIYHLRGKLTVFIIAHRLSTMAHVDRVLVLDKGRIIEEGKPQELLDNPRSYFYRMYHLKEN